MNVSALRLRNFRGFRDATIELKPLTVLLGPNSAGKSSFSHALAALAHAQWIHAGTRQMTLTPKDEKSADEWPIDLGHYADLCTTVCNEPVQVEFRTAFGDVAFGFGCLAGTTDLRLSYLKHPLAPNATLPHGLNVQSSHQPSATSTTAIPSPDMSLLHTPVGLELMRLDELNWRGPGKQIMRPQLSGLLLETLRYETGTDIQLDTAVRHEIGAFLEGVTYLRASRKRPARGYAAAQTGRSAIGYAGERAANLLMSMPDEQVTLVKLPPVPNSAVDALKVIDASAAQSQVTLPSAVGAWLRELGLAASVETRPSPTSRDRVQIRVVLREGAPARDITEVGYGLSQVIPVLVGGLIQPPEALFIVDLPEAHLHPHPQALMADFFCAMVLSGKSVLIETHSEMFFHRLRLRAAMSEELRSKIGVYFFDPQAAGECPPPRRVGLEQDAELKWPVGFLQEAWEIEMQVSAAREGRRLKYQ
jgi:predicted ATPase